MKLSCFSPDDSHITLVLLFFRFPFDCFLQKVGSLFKEKKLMKYKSWAIPSISEKSHLVKNIKLHVYLVTPFTGKVKSHQWAKNTIAVPIQIFHKGIITNKQIIVWNTRLIWLLLVCGQWLKHSNSIFDVALFQINLRCYQSLFQVTVILNDN